MRSSSRITALAAALLTIATAAVAAAAEDPVVPADGTVAGQGYAKWLRNSWLVSFSHAPDAPACLHYDTSAGRVAVLLGGFSGKPEHHTCNVPTGRAVYVGGFTAQCSTIDPPHGMKASQLKRCARKLFKIAKHLSATIDGQRVVGYHDLITATSVFKFSMPRKNILGTRKRSGKSAAYGAGLLLDGLTAGEHTINVTGAVPQFAMDVTFTLNVG